MDPLQKAFEPSRRDSSLMIAFGQRLVNQFSINQIYRRAKEIEWLESLRQYKGLYDPNVKIEADASKVYPKLTRSKENIVLSRLHEMLFPETERNWEIEPTPEPKMSKEVVKQIALSLVTVGEDGMPVLPSAEELKLALKKDAAERCEKMMSVIDDQLIEMKYSEEVKKVLRSGLRYGTGIMKGPMIGQRTKRVWEPRGNGDYEEMETKDEVPELKAVRIWDWYPDMSVTEQEQMEGSFERHIMTKHDLRVLMKREDFYPEMIERYLRDNPEGNYIPATWETELQCIEVEAGGGKYATRLSMSTTNPLTGESGEGSNRPVGKKYEVLEFWGYVDGGDLRACGLEVEDESLEYAANIWVIPGRGMSANCPIKAVLYPGALSQYKLFYFEKDETSIFGEGLPRIMRHSQIAVSAAARMVLDNAACVAGPNVEVNWSLMTPDTDYSSIYPRKIWYREGKGIDAQYPACRPLNFDSHIEELIRIVELFKQFGDEETCLPTWMIGQQVNNETAQATSGRMSFINVSIKDVVKNFDSFTEGIIQDLYAWNMDFSDRVDIKGDYQCKAKGVSSLVMKEIRMQMINQLSTTLTPEEKDYLPEREMLAEKMKVFDLPIKLRSDEEVAKIREQRSQSAESQLALKMAEAEVQYKRAQTMNQLTKAKKLNVESIKDSQTPPEIPENADPRLVEAELLGKETDRAGKEAEIRRQEEAHASEERRKDESHALDIAERGARASADLAGQEEERQHSMKMKEKMTDASAEAKKKAAAMKKPAAKPAK